MNKVKQSFILCFVLIFAITSVSITFSGLHIINSLHKSEEASIDDTMKKAESPKVSDDVEIEIYSELPSSFAFTEDEAKVIYPEEMYEVIYHDADGNIVPAETITPDSVYCSKYIANKLGRFEVKVVIGEEEITSHIVVKDTTAPELNLKEVTIKENEAYSVNSFIVSCQDNNKKECSIAFKDEKMSTNKTEGTYEITIVAQDESNNKTEQSTKLIIQKASEVHGTPSTPTQPEQPTTPTQPTQPDVVEPPKPQIYVPSSSEISGAVSSGSAYHDTLLNMTNEYRAEVGLPPLTINGNLNRIATLRAIEMARNGCAWTSAPDATTCFSHTRPNGSDWSTAFDSYTAVRIIGENLGYGYSSAAGVMQGWKNSPDHYANIINEGFTQIGFGVYNYNGTWYWVQAFGG